LDNDFFAEKFDSFLTSIESDSIIGQIRKAFNNLKPENAFQNEIAEIILALEIYNNSFEECIQGLQPFVKAINAEKEFEEILSHIQII
jgi:DNA (cytosine-5)-methyltransferase 1